MIEEKADPIFPDPMTREALAEVGVVVEKEEKSGTYVLCDFQPVCAMTGTAGLEILPIAVALERYDWLREKYYWKSVPADLDEITSRCASQTEPNGFFARVKMGARILFPCQAGFVWRAQASIR